MKKNYNGLWYLVLTLVLILISIKCNAQQQYPIADATPILGNMQGGWSIGNECGKDNYMVTNVYSDMNMNYENLEILHAHLIVHGVLVNEGEITFLCDTAILEFDNTLDDPIVEVFEFKVYPNPAKNSVNVNGAGIDRIQFVDIYGIVKKDFTTNTSKNKIDISNLGSGLYIIYVTTTNGSVQAFKLIKR